jgi:hypothetical protein
LQPPRKFIERIATVRPSAFSEGTSLRKMRHRDIESLQQILREIASRYGFAVHKDFRSRAALFPAPLQNNLFSSDFECRGNRIVLRSNIVTERFLWLAVIAH